MTARAEHDWQVFYCAVCGPVLMLPVDEDDETCGDIVLHHAIPHPDLMTFDEEERPQ